MEGTARAKALRWEHVSSSRNQSLSRVANMGKRVEDEVREEDRLYSIG